MTSIFSSILVTVFSIFLSVATGKLLLGPEDTEVIVGSTVHLRCRTSNGYSVNWDHIGLGSTTTKEVYFSGSIIKPYDERFVVEVNKENGYYNLTIRSVEWQDAGRYECIDMAGQGERRGAELVVLAHPPTCQSFGRLDDLVGENDCGIEQSLIEFQCHLRFVGNTLPKITWLGSDGNKIIPRTIMIEKESDQITVTSTISAQWHMNGLKYIFQTTKSGYNWTSDTVNISYVVNSTYIKTSAAPGNHRCEAKSSQPCNYTWLKDTSDDQSVVTNNQTLTVTDTGQYLCLAECRLRQQSCTVQPMMIYQLPEHETNGAVQSPVLFWVLIAIIIILLILLILFGSLVIYVCWMKARKRRRMVACGKNGSPPLIDKTEKTDECINEPNGYVQPTVGQNSAIDATCLIKCTLMANTHVENGEVKNGFCKDQRRQT